MNNIGRPENTVEGYLQKKATEHGCICWKFTSPGNKGVPDRIVIGIDIHGQKHTDFVETKAPGEKPRLLQRIVHDEMRGHGASVFVLATRPAVDEYFRTYFERKEESPP